MCNLSPLSLVALLYIFVYGVRAGQSDIYFLCNKLCVTLTLTYVYLRHNNIRDLTANFLEEAGCKAVTIEPQLLPITGETFQFKSTITVSSARAVWMFLPEMCGVTLTRCLLIFGCSTALHRQTSISL